MQGEKKYSKSLHATEPLISSGGLLAYLARMQTLHLPMSFLPKNRGDSLPIVGLTVCCHWVSFCHDFVFVINSLGSTDSTESFKRGSGKYGSFRKRPTKDDVVIYSFEFEECVLAAYNSEPVECTLHGRLELRELAPDAVRVYTTKIYIYIRLYCQCFCLINFV